MKIKTLGRSDSRVSAIGLGLMPLAGVYGGDSVSAEKVLNHALDIGIGFWDTSDNYGLDGSSESQISGVLNERRSEVFIATKFGFRRKPGFSDGFLPGATYLDGSASYVREACEASLKRLGVDCIDLYYAHRLDPNTPVEETVGAMADLVDDGLVRRIGLSECTVDDLRRAEDIHHIDAVQSELSILTRYVLDGVLPLCKENGTAFVAFSPLSRGLLSGSYTSPRGERDFRNRLPRFGGDGLMNNREIVTELGRMASRKGCSLSQLSLAWVMAQGDNVIPIPGTKVSERLDENAGSLDVTLSTDELEEIDSIVARHPDIGDRYGSNEKKFLKR